MNKNIFHGALLESVLLNFISDASDAGLHGYGLLKLIQRKYGVRLGSSSLYPELNCLEKRGLIQSKWEVGTKRACKQYRITRKGEMVLKEYFVELRAVIPLLVSS